MPRQPAVKASIDGIPLLGSKLVHWRIDTGVKPNITNFDVTPENLEKLLKIHTPVTLDIDPGTGNSKPLKVENLWILGNAPGPNPNIARVTVADRRWFWKYNFIARRFNIRRKSNIRRLLNPSTPPQRDPIREDIAYAPYSLNYARDPWTALEVLTTLMEAILETEEIHGGNAAKFGKSQIDTNLRAVLDNFPIENFIVEDYGDEAIRRFLGMIPRAAVTVDYDGEIKFFSRISGGEDQLTRVDIEHETVGGGHVEEVNNANIRPCQIDVLFTREIEVRFDFFESVRRYSDATARYMENVLPVPDFQLDMKGGLFGGRTVCQGTWVSIPEALEAWGKLPDGTQIDIPWLRRASVPFVDMFTGAFKAGLDQPDIDWSGRLSALQTHFRRTFRINRRWIDRMFKFNNYRVATLDPSIGQRAPAGVYANYAYLFSQRSMVQFARAFPGSQRRGAAYVVNVQGYPENGKINAETKTAAAATVNIVDHDQGIIQLNFAGDPFRMHEQILPSFIELSGSGKSAGDGAVSFARPKIAGPQSDITQVEYPISFDSTFDEKNVAQLSADHRVSVILTCIPGAPNHDGQLERIEVTPKMIREANALPPVYHDSLKECNGPRMELRIGPGMETARVAWVDDEKGIGAQKIAEAFRLGSTDLKEYIVNQDPAGETKFQAGDINAIALAAAAAAYATFVDREKGMKTDHLSPQARLQGFASSLGHMIREDGSALTSVAMAEDTVRMSLYTNLDTSTRNILMRIANPGKDA